jgi:hypothetical protein
MFNFFNEGLSAGSCAFECHYLQGDCILINLKGGFICKAYLSVKKVFTSTSMKNVHKVGLT